MSAWAGYPPQEECRRVLPGSRRLPQSSADYKTQAPSVSGAVRPAADQAAGLPDDVLFLGDDLPLQLLAVGDGQVPPGQAADRRIQVIECLFHDPRQDLRPDPARAAGLC